MKGLELRSSGKFLSRDLISTIGWGHADVLALPIADLVSAVWGHQRHFAGSVAQGHAVRAKNLWELQARLVL